MQEDVRIASEWLTAATSDAIKSTGLTFFKINARVKKKGKKSLNLAVSNAESNSQSEMSNVLIQTQWLKSSLL